jgi:Transglutaminase-like superfamily
MLFLRKGHMQLRIRLYTRLLISVGVTLSMVVMMIKYPRVPSLFLSLYSTRFSQQTFDVAVTGFSSVYLKNGGGGSYRSSSSSSSSSSSIIFAAKQPESATTAAITELSVQENNSLNSDNTYQYRSNTTHIVWYKSTMTAATADTATTTTSNAATTIYDCTWQAIEDAKIDAYNYLRQNIMSFDVPFLETMGFHNNSTNSQDDTDGLYNGMIGPVIDIALQNKIQFVHADVVPKPIFYEYVLNYANVNENRNNIRTLLQKQLIQPLFLSSSSSSSSSTTTVPDTARANYTIADVIRIINTNMWQLLAPNKHVDCIQFVSGQTPIIFDPMSVIAFGYGSCTGISILFVQALRTAGIPARLAGTPAWNQNQSHGNHNWVEVWLPQLSHSSSITGIVVKESFRSIVEDEVENENGIWLFIEGSPNQTSADSIDDWNPCVHFLCSANSLANNTQYYAARLENTTTSTYFPLAWDDNNKGVPAINRTLYYHTMCAQCN